MDEKPKVLILDDEPNLVKAIERFCRLEGYDVQGYTGHTEALAAIETWRPAVILLDVNMPVSGIDILRHLVQTGIEAQVIIMTGQATLDLAVTALKEGAFDFVAKPFDDPQCLTLKIDRALQHIDLVRRASKSSLDQSADRFLVGNSQALQSLRKLIAKVGPTQGTALIFGETGVGKEMVARALHAASPRAQKPFLAINCAAFSENLIESELFGHEKGSFTGAMTRREGIFIEANRGTLFLDEIGEMPLSLQAKLLRVLQEGEVRRVGGNTTERVDVRLIAATNRNLQEEIKKGTFREDLYFRLNVINLQVPPPAQPAR
jgi:DNA-binding NtrC family response regulator